MSRKNESNKYAYLFLYICIALILSLFIFKKYIFDGYYFFNKGILSDLIRANLPTYYMIYDNISEGFHIWDWRMGIGTSIMSHSDALFDPFTYVCFMAGRDHIPYMMIYSFIVRIISSGVCFYLLTYSIWKNKECSYITALMYSFSGYMMIMGSNLALGTVMVYLPVLIRGFYEICHNISIKYYVVGLSLLLFYSLYYSYICLIAGVISFFAVCLTKRKFLKREFTTFILATALSFLITSVSIISNYDILANSNRVGNQIFSISDLFLPDFKMLFTSLLRTFSVNAIGNPTNPNMGYVGYKYDYFQGTIFISSFLPLIVISAFKKNKRNVIILGIIFLALNSIPLFSFIFNGMSAITLRWDFLAVFGIVLWVAYYLTQQAGNLDIDKYDIIKSILVTIVIYLFSSTIFFRDALHVNDTLVKSTIICIIECVVIQILVGTFFIFRSKENANKMVVSFLTAIIVMDVLFNYLPVYNSKYSGDIYDQSNRCSYQDDSAEVINIIKKRDKGVYRIDKTFDSVVTSTETPSLNDSMVQNYMGIKSYSSLNNAEYTNYLLDLGIYVAIPLYASELQILGMDPHLVNDANLNYIAGVYGRENLYDLLGVKYIITRKNEKIHGSGYKYLFSYKSCKVFENTDVLPLVYTSESAIGTNQYHKMSYEDREKALLQYAVVDDKKKNNNDVSKKGISDKNISNIKMVRNQDLRFDVKGSSCRYIIIAAPYDKGWKIYVDGKKSTVLRVDNGLAGTKIKLNGKHTVELVYENKQIKLGYYLSLIGVFAFVVLLIVEKNKKSEVR